MYVYKRKVLRKFAKVSRYFAKVTRLFAKVCINSRKFRVISRTLLVYSRIFFLYENEPNIDFRSNEFGRTQLIFQRIQNIFVLQTAYVRGAISKCSYIMSIKLLRAHHIYKRHIVQVIRMYAFHLWKKVLFFGKQWHSWPGGEGLTQPQSTGFSVS